MPLTYDIYLSSVSNSTKKKTRECAMLGLLHMISYLNEPLTACLIRCAMQADIIIQTSKMFSNCS